MKRKTGFFNRVLLDMYTFGCNLYSPFLNHVH